MPVLENQHVSQIIYKLIYGFIRLLSLIPFRAGQFLGRGLGRAFARVPLGREMVSLDNLYQAFGCHMSTSEIKDLNRRIIMHFGQMLFEVPHILRLRPGNLDKYVVFQDEENLLSAIKKDKGVFALTAHFGNWELMSAAVSLRFATKGSVVVRPLDFPPADRLIRDLRSKFGTELIPKHRALRKIMRAIKDNRVVGILLDQSVDWYEGVFVQFMGIPACTNKGLAFMALKTGAPVVPIFSIRQSDGRYRIVFEKEVELVRTRDKIRDIEENTALFTSVTEKYVRQYPEQWFWFHRRWKTKNACMLPDDWA